MERVYLLLRNNQQTGPFTIGELLQQQLQPSDMIWIEGKSTAWTYLSELELIPFIKNTDLSDDSKIKTGDEIERKAEELRQKVLAAAPKANLSNHSVEIETYPSSFNLPDGNIELVDHRKEKTARKNTAIGELVLTCFVLGLFVLGIYKGQSFLGARHQVQNSVATQLDTRDEHAARQSVQEKQHSIPVAIVVDTMQQHDSLLALQTPKQKVLAVKKSKDSSLKEVLTINEQDAVQPVKKQELAPPPIDVSKENAIKKVDTPAKKEVAKSQVNTKAMDKPDKEEKKGFLRGLFKKKKKDD